MTRAQWLEDLTVRYAKALGRCLDELGGESVFGPYYGDTRSILAFEASDGFAVFYLPAGARSAGGLGPHPQIRSGFNLFTVPKANLDQVCEETSANFLRILPVEVGCVPQLSASPPPPGGPYDIEGMPQVWLISQEIFNHLSEQIQVTNSLVSPFLRVENGIVREILPTRVKLWSPLCPAGSGDQYRMYAWTHADLWLRAQDLPLNGDAVEDLARTDALALRVLLQMAPQLLRPGQLTDSGSTAAEVLDRRCSEFEELLEHAGSDEELIHQWLLQPGNKIFLNTSASLIRSKVQFGAHFSDFVIRCEEDKYVLCEIEPATARIFLKNGEPSSHLNHAVQQVIDWQRYVRENLRTVRDELNLPGIYEPKGLVILGRSCHVYEQPNVSHRWRDIKNRGRDGVEVVTYDDMITRVRHLAQSLRTVLSSEKST